MKTLSFLDHALSGSKDTYELTPFLQNLTSKTALQKGMQAMLVVNKIDRPAARPDYVVDQAFDLFVELGKMFFSCREMN